MNKNYVFIFVLLVTMMATTGFDAFAEELVVKKPQLSIGSNHLGSMIKTQTVSDDGSTWIFVTATEPVERESMTINVRFTDKNGQELYDVNYDIIATQNDQIILDKTMVNQQMGIQNHLTQALPSNDGVTIKITLQGTGTDIPITGPHGESIQVVIPEFGAITTIVLGISVLSVIIISAKNKMTFKSLTYNKA